MKKRINTKASKIVDREKLKPSLRNAVHLGSVALDILSDAFQYASVAMNTDPQYTRIAARMGPLLALDYLDELRRREKFQAIRRLKRRGFIETEVTAEGIRLALTEKGVAESLRIQVLNADVLDDGTECVVIFDIPENQRKLRQTLAYFLKRSGFILYQRSVYISPFDAFVPLARLLSLHGASKWIKIYRGIPFDCSGEASKFVDRQILKPLDRV